jgi:long-chain acyl-CoA synthetase
MGRLDSEGYLYLTDRANDMVISGGLNIYPAEIESVLYQMPAVRDRLAGFTVPKLVVFDDDLPREDSRRVLEGIRQPDLTEPAHRLVCRESLILWQYS